MKIAFFICCWMIISPLEKPQALLSTISRSMAPIDWAATTNWKLYDIKAKSAFGWPVDTLQHIKYIALNEDTMRVFLRTTTPLPLNRRPVWMGYYVASCRLPDGKSLKIEVSQYGGFFYEQSQSRYYEVGLPLRRNWLNFFANKLNTFEEQ